MNQRIGPANSWQCLLGKQMRKLIFVMTLAAILSASVLARAQGTTSQVNGTVTDLSLIHI